MKTLHRFILFVLVVCLPVAPFGTVQGAVATWSVRDDAHNEPTRSLPLAVLNRQSGKPQTLTELQSRIAALLDAPKFAAARMAPM